MILHEHVGSFSCRRFVVGLGLGFVLGWGFGRDLGFVVRGFAVLGFLWVRFMIWVLMIYANC